MSSERARRAAAPIVAWALAPDKELLDSYRQSCVDGDFDDHFIVQAFTAFEAEIVEQCCGFIDGSADAYLKSASIEPRTSLAAAECRASASALKVAAQALRATAIRKDNP